MTTTQKNTVKNKLRRTNSSYKSNQSTPFKTLNNLNNLVNSPQRSIDSEKLSSIDKLTTSFEQRLTTKFQKKPQDGIYVAPRTALTNDQDELEINMPNFLVRTSSNEKQNLPFDILFEDAKQAKKIDPQVEQMQKKIDNNQIDLESKMIPQLLYCQTCQCERVTVATKHKNQIAQKNSNQKKPSFIESLFCCSSYVDKDDGIPTITHVCRSCGSLLASY